MGVGEHQAFDTLSGLVARFVAEADLGSTLGWLTDRCAELPGVSASGLMLADRDGALDNIAASSEPTDRLQQLEQQIVEGPAHDSYDSATRIDCLDLAGAGDTWPQYAVAASQRELRAVHAFPLLILGRAVGTLTMFRSTTGALGIDVLEAGQALANTAALGVEGHHATQYHTLADQLQIALDSRVLIEQAKGLLAERLGVSLEESFTVLRQHARRNGRRLVDVATEVLNGSLALPAKPQR
ncbi:GAF and ANTAR domain-containing protein [Kribbella sp. WER1]